MRLPFSILRIRARDSVHCRFDLNRRPSCGKSIFINHPIPVNPDFSREFYFRWLTAWIFIAGAACAFPQSTETRSLDAMRVDPLTEERRWHRIQGHEFTDFVLADLAPDGSLGILSAPDRLGIFDGYSSRLLELPDDLRLGPVNAMTISSGGVYCLVFREGIVLHDGQSWRQVSDEGLGRRLFGNIIETRDGILWAGIESGIARIDPVSGRCEITPTPAPVLGLCEGPARDSLWVLAFPDGSVWEYPLSGGRIAAGAEPVQRGAPFDSSLSRAMLMRASDGRVWLINENHNLPPRVFDPARGDWTGINLSRLGGDNLNFSILETPDGAVWISSRGSLHIHKDGEWRIYHSPEFSLPGARSILLHGSDGFVSILETSGMGVRIDYGGRQGVSFDGLHFQDETPDGDILFISVDDEVVRWRPGSAEAEFYPPEVTGISTPGALIVHSNGDWFLAGSDNHGAAVAVFDGTEWWRHAYPEVGISFGHLGLLECSNGEVWLGCAQMAEEFPGYEGGLVVFSPEAGGGYAVSRRLPPDFAFRNWSLQAGGAGTPYTSGLGLYENTGAGAIPIELPAVLRNKWIDQIAVDSRGTVWCAAWSHGVFRLRDGEWTQFTETDGLGSMLASFVIILDDDSPVVSTREGHYRFDGERWAPFMNYMDGLHRGSGRVAQSGDGSVWVNHTHVDWYYRSQRVEDYSKDKRRSFGTVQYAPDAAPPVVRWASDPPSLFRNTDLVFRWKGIDPWSKTPPDRLRYSHRINGGAWSPFSAATGLTLDEMRGGKHLIEIRARDADFNITAVPLRAEFAVILPLWRQGWFIASLAAGVAFVVAVAALFVRQRIRHMLELEGVKIRFFTHLSHELKTPLSLILGPVERLQNEVGDMRHQQYLSLIKSNSQRLLFLVNQLLDFRKLQLNKLAFQPEKGDFVQFARNCISVFHGWIREKEQAIALESTMDRFVFSFPHEVYHKIIDNLLGNAIKYTPRGGHVTVRIDRRRGPDGETRGVLEVEDTGPGIAETDQKAVFEPFFRGSSAERKAEGTGIGLAFVKELVDSIDAEIELISPVHPGDAERPGSCFRVTFPVKPAEEAAGVRDAPQPTVIESTESGATAATAGSAEGRLVLLVEDNHALREFIAGELSEFARVETADSMETGFAKARELIPDIIVSDVVMGGKSGFDLCRALKEDAHTSHVPVVLLTALRSEEHKRLAYESGADDFITKPVSPEILRLKLRNLLDTQQHTRRRVRQQFVDDNRMTGRSQADQQFLDKVKAVVDAELGNEQFDVNALAEKLGFSRSAFYRKFNSLTDLSPASFIRTKRLRQAAKWLAEGEKSVSEIAYDVGFSDAGYFSRVFKDEFKCPPSEFARRKETAAGSPAGFRRTSA